MRLSVKTIERWLYIARNSAQALEALARRVPKHAGTHPAVSKAVGEILRQLRLKHPRWTYRLVHDSLGAIARERSEFGKSPSYQTVCRYTRYELPSAYRTLQRVHVRVARWDLSGIDLVDPRQGTHLSTLYPIDKESNADGRRRALPQPGAVTEPPKPVGVAPLLRQYVAEYAATGLPPAYIPLERKRRDPHVGNDVDDDALPTTPEGV